MKKQNPKFISAIIDDGGLEPESRRKLDERIKELEAEIAKLQTTLNITHKQAEMLHSYCINDEQFIWFVSKNKLTTIPGIGIKTAAKIKKNLPKYLKS